MATATVRMPVSLPHAQPDEARCYQIGERRPGPQRREPVVDREQNHADQEHERWLTRSEVAIGHQAVQELTRALGVHPVGEFPVRVALPHREQHELE